MRKVLKMKVLPSTALAVLAVVTVFHCCFTSTLFLPEWVFLGVTFF